ncbi:MAG: hypothetical protein GX447_09285 [Elusimicrobia bacterium]|nr:hypothetical protein [Elusimicrobiota bacterium]
MENNGFYRIKKYCFKPQSVMKSDSAVILPNSDSYFEKFFEIIEKAEKIILLEVYEFADDSLGIEAAKALKKKASQGVKVYVIYDSVGSWLSERSFFEDMKRSGINIAEYNTVRRFYNLRKFFRRDHRKIIAADFQKACVGGFNISLDYAPQSMGGRNWKDCGAYISGESAAKISELFFETWRKITKEEPPLVEKNIRSLNGVSVSVASGSGIRNYFSIRRNYKYAIDAASEEIFITNAYFLPDKIIYRRLIKAARRGVEVKIIVPEKTDHPYVSLASWAMFPGLIKNGAEIYRWKGKILHSKTAVIDGFWTSLGSHNLDHRSLHYNLELNINIYDEFIGKSMREEFLKDLENCEKITLEKCKSRSFALKALSRFIYFFRSWL